MANKHEYMAVNDREMAIVDAEMMLYLREMKSLNN